MAPVADANFKHIEVRQYVKGNDLIKWSFPCGRVPIGIAEEPSVNLLIEFAGKLLCLDRRAPVISHRVAFPPVAVVCLPVWTCIVIGKRRRR